MRKIDKSQLTKNTKRKEKRKEGRPAHSERSAEMHKDTPTSTAVWCLLSDCSECPKRTVICSKPPTARFHSFQLLQ